MIENTIKNFDIVTENNIETIGVRELTLKERQTLWLHFEETIKNSRRKEYLELAKLMEGKEKNKYLVECANSNKVTLDEINEESNTFNGISEILKITSNKQLDWLSILSDADINSPIVNAWYYSLGIEVPEETSETEKVEESNKSVVNTKIDDIKGDGSTQSATFQG